LILTSYDPHRSAGFQVWIDPATLCGGLLTGAKDNNPPMVMTQIITLPAALWRAHHSMGGEWTTIVLEFNPLQLSSLAGVHNSSGCISQPYNPPVVVVSFIPTSTECFCDKVLYDQPL